MVPGSVLLVPAENSAYCGPRANLFGPQVVRNSEGVQIPDESLILERYDQGGRALCLDPETYSPPGKTQEPRLQLFLRVILRHKVQTWMERMFKDTRAMFSPSLVKRICSGNIQTFMSMCLPKQRPVAAATKKKNARGKTGKAGKSGKSGRASSSKKSKKRTIEDIEEEEGEEGEKDQDNDQPPLKKASKGPKSKAKAKAKKDDEDMDE